VPEGKVEDDVIVSTVDAVAAMVMDVATDFVCAGLPLSLTVTVKLKVPLAFGVPEITPLPAATLSPAGRLPEVTDQV
jgi:predicted signal transduction protein with EAL and GGDEF domain